MKEKQKLKVVGEGIKARKKERKGGCQEKKINHMDERKPYIDVNNERY